MAAGVWGGGGGGDRAGVWWLRLLPGGSTQTLLRPGLGLKAVPRAQFQAMWNGIYFVLTSAPQVGTSNFNGPRQWQPIARAPVGQPFLDPLSVQALTLSAPFYRDF